MNTLNEAIQRKIKYEDALKIGHSMPKNTLKRWRDKLKQAEEDIKTYEKDLLNSKKMEDVE